MSTPKGEVLTLTIAREWQATFEVPLVGKYQRRLPGFDARVFRLNLASGKGRKPLAAALKPVYQAATAEAAAAAVNAFERGDWGKKF